MKNGWKISSFSFFEASSILKNRIFINLQCYWEEKYPEQKGIIIVYVKIWTILTNEQMHET